MYKLNGLQSNWPRSFFLRFIISIMVSWTKWFLLLFMWMSPTLLIDIFIENICLRFIININISSCSIVGDHPIFLFSYIITILDSFKDELSLIDSDYFSKWRYSPKTIFEHIISFLSSLSFTQYYYNEYCQSFHC